MLFRKVKEANVILKFKAFSLLEMLISLMLSTLLILTISHWYGNILTNRLKQSELLKLQQNTHQILRYFQKHIQHIGYRSQYRKDSNYDLFAINGKDYKLVNPNCLLFFYDLNSDGCIGTSKTGPCVNHNINNTYNISKEIFGFHLKKNNLYIFDDNANFYRCYGKQCQKWAESCEANKWKNTSERADYQIEKLVFKWEKEGVLLRINLKLKSVKNAKISYEAESYVYLINSGG